jgi:hypothetical protein
MMSGAGRLAVQQKVQKVRTRPFSSSTTADLSSVKICHLTPIVRDTDGAAFSQLRGASGGSICENKHKEDRVTGNKFGVIVLAVFTFAFACAARSNAGTEIVRDYSAPALVYDYTPPPPTVYYAPPPVRVVVVPAYRYYVAPVRLYAHRRVVGPRVYSAPDGWR